MLRIRFISLGDTAHAFYRPIMLLCTAAFTATLLLLLPLYLWSLEGGVAHAAANADTEIELFTANLSGADEGSPNTSIATGRAVMTILTDTLYYRIFVADIDGITLAHIHEGPPGVNGPPVHTLYSGTGAFDAAHPISGTLTLSPAEKAKLQAGDYYVNVHTAAFGGGEIRGQLNKETLATDYNALLLGRNQVGPTPVVTDASAIGNFTLTPTDTYTLTYELAVSDIVSITLAHIHLGAVGENGPVVHDLYTGVGDFDPSNPISGTLNLSAKNVLDMVSGYFYVNIHTNAYPNGEVRGQIGGARLFDANLGAAHEVANVESIATGRAVLALSRDTTELSYRVLVDDIEGISAAHIHREAVGVNGPVVHTLYTGAGDFDADNPISGTLTLTRGQVFDLITGNYYINVHTGANPGGEIRGQIEEFTPPTHLNAVLTGGQESPPVDTDALGIARLRFDAQSNILYHTVVITDIVDVNAAHIHRAARSVNGGVVFGLFDNSGGDTFGPDDPIGGGNELDAVNLVDLFTGYLYVNVHTDAHTSGEIRGQIGGAQIFQASLNGAAEEQSEPVITTASGRAILALSDDTTQLAYRVLVNQLTDISGAHIHRAPAGVNGGVIFNLFPAGEFDAQHPVSGTVSLDADQVLDLIGGNYYINVHTPEYPAGEIRGQVEPYTPPAQMHATLSGAEETVASAAVDTSAVGISRLTLDSDLNMVRYSVAVADIEQIIAAHIHLGPTGVPGPIRFTLFANEGPFGPDDPIADALPFNAAGWVDLLTGYHYVNVHTTPYPSGEIRGQAGGASLYQAVLSGDQEVPPIETPATGHAVLALSADSTQLVYRVSATKIGTISNAHIHKAPFGASGGVVFPLYTGGATPPSQPISGTLPITTVQIFDLLQGNYYVNIHTDANGGGEVRGQVEAYTPPAELVANLTPEQEVVVSQIGPNGKATFTLEPELGILYYTVVISDITGVTAAHIHKAPKGVNGGVIFGLFGLPGVFDADNPIGGTIELDELELVDLLTAYYYVNVHTTDAPGGKIRGQILIPVRLNIPAVSKE